MAALTESGKGFTQLSERRKYFTKVTGNTATDGTITIDGFSSIDSVQITPAEVSTTDCIGAVVKTVSTNVLTLNWIKPAGTICTQNPIAVYVEVIGR